MTIGSAIATTAGANDTSVTAAVQAIGPAAGFVPENRRTTFNAPAANAPAARSFTRIPSLQVSSTGVYPFWVIRNSAIFVSCAPEFSRFLITL